MNVHIPLHKFTVVGHFPKVKYTIKYIADMEMVSSFDYLTPLHVAPYNSIPTYSNCPSIIVCRIIHCHSGDISGQASFNKPSFFIILIWGNTAYIDTTKIINRFLKL